VGCFILSHPVICGINITENIPVYGHFPGLPGLAGGPKGKKKHLEIAGVTDALPNSQASESKQSLL